MATGLPDAADIAGPHLGLYETLYREIDPLNRGEVVATEGAAFLRRSGLPLPILGRVWDAADYRRAGSLDRRGAFLAFKLVAAAQQGRQPTVAEALAVLNPPVFAPRAVTPSLGGLHTPSAPATPTPQQSGPPPRPAGVQNQQQWTMTEQEEIKYDAIFESLRPVDGRWLDGATVRPVLLNSGLPPSILARIWELADQDHDGRLDRHEMRVALHLVYRAMSGDSIPTSLPDVLLAGGALAARLSRPSSMMSLEGVGIGASIPPANLPEPQRAYSVQPSLQTPVRRISASSASGFGAIPSSDGWPVVVRAEWANAFAAADSDHDGWATGVELRQALLATELPQQELAQLWALADLRRSGRLNVEQFALCMYLSEKRRSGQPLPPALPPFLIPPSLRSAAAATTTASNTTPGTPSLDEIEASDEVKQLAAEIEQLGVEKRSAEAAIVQLEADQTVKNSKIKNLQIELQTLETTAVQLERQKHEATRKLAEYDRQIEQLRSGLDAQKAKADDARRRLDTARQAIAASSSSPDQEQAAHASADAELAQLAAEERELDAQLAACVSGYERIVDDATRQDRLVANRATACGAAEAETTRLKERLEVLERSLNDENEAAVRAHCSQPYNVINFDPESGGSAAGWSQSADPFTNSTNSNGFVANFGNNPEVGQSKAPPPRPTAPPIKKTAAESTAVAPPTTAAAAAAGALYEDPFDSADPFASSGAAIATGDGFADFDNFGDFK